MLNQNALTTLARLKSYLDVTNDREDTVLEYLINGASAFIQRRCDREFRKQAYTEYIRGTGSPNLFLKGYPIVGSVALAENTSGDASDDFDDISSDDFWTFTEEGYLEADGFDFTARPRAYRAIYEAGYILQQGTVTGENIALPDDLEMACWRLCAGVYNQRKSEGTSSQTLADYSVQFAKVVDGDDFLNEVLANFRRPAL
jgi:hypothetical protein